VCQFPIARLLVRRLPNRQEGGICGEEFAVKTLSRRAPPIPIEEVYTGDMATPSLVKWFAGFTTIFGLPLYFTKFIRETRFPEGLTFVFVYTWGLIAVVALPLLLFAQLYFLVRGLKSGPEGRGRSLLFISSFALCFGLVAECVFISARR
jgi:hypothetical protein